MAYDEYGNWVDDASDYAPAVSEDYNWDTYQTATADDTQNYLPENTDSSENSYTEADTSVPTDTISMDEKLKEISKLAGGQVLNEDNALRRSNFDNLDDFLKAKAIMDLPREGSTTPAYDNKSNQEAMAKDIPQEGGSRYIIKKTIDPDTGQYVQDTTDSSGLNPSNIKIVSEAGGKIIESNQPVFSPEGGNFKSSEEIKKDQEAEAARLQELEAAKETKVLEDRMKSIQAEKDPDKRAIMLSELQADTTNHLTSLHEKAFHQLEEKLGIPKLVEAYKISAQKDMAFMQQGGQLRGGMSTETHNLYNQLQLADKQFKLEQGSLKSIPAIQETANRVDAFLKTQKNLIEKQSGIRIRNAEAAAYKEQQLQDRVTEFKASASPAQIAALSVVYPFAANPQATGEDRVKALIMDMSNPAVPKEKKKAIGELLDNADRPASVLSSAVLGNPYARQLAISQQSTLSGKSAKDVESDLNTMQGLVQDPAKYKAILNSMINKESKDWKSSLLKDQQAVDKASANPKTWAATAPQRLAKVDEFMSSRNVQAIQSDVSSWPGLQTDPVAGPIIKDLQRTSNSRTVGMEEFIAKYIGNSSLEEGAARTRVLQESIRAAADNVNKLSYGHVPTDRLVNQVVAKASVAHTISGEMGAAISDLFSSLVGG